MRHLLPLPRSAKAPNRDKATLWVLLSSLLGSAIGRRGDMNMLGRKSGGDAEGLCDLLARLTDVVEDLARTARADEVLLSRLANIRAEALRLGRTSQGRS